MISGLIPYPEMKESGVKRIGQVPTHWKVPRLKKWVEVNRIVLAEDTNPEYTFDYVDIGSVETGRLVAEPKRIRFGNAPSRARRVIRPGDTIISTVRTYLKAIWHAESVTNDLIASTGFAVLTPREGTVPKYVSYFCQSEAFTDRVTAESIGMAYPAIAETKLGTLEVTIPPLAEQAAIVGFLDQVEQHIRRYIHAKQKLIALLEEQKHAIVGDVVTGQIDVRTGRPYGTYKKADPGWLECVPRHWNRVRLKTLLRPVDRRSTTGEETLLSLRRDHGVVVYADHFTRPPQGATLVGFKHVKTGQLVVNRLQANNGLVFCSNLNGLVSPDYSVFEKRTSLQMQYLSDLLRTEGYRTRFRQEARGLGTGTAGFLRLYDDAFLRTVVHLPPPAEQHLILQTLESARRKLKALTGNMQRELELMKEFQACLVADVVTGKLDVRDAMGALTEGNG